MSKFERDHSRYTVIKMKDLIPVQRILLDRFLSENDIPVRECLVIEPDWPIYDECWENVKRMAEGEPSFKVERDALEMAILEEGFEIGSHGSGYCITDESLARRFPDQSHGRISIEGDPHLFYEAIGWAHAQCCLWLDEGKDPRTEECSQLVTKAENDFGIRSAAQREEDEAIDDMLRIYYESDSVSLTDTLRDIYRAGYRKES